MKVYKQLRPMPPAQDPGLQTVIAAGLEVSVSMMAKQRVFALYWGQRVLIAEDKPRVIDDVWIKYIWDTDYLLLTAVDDIPDPEAEIIADTFRVRSADKLKEYGIDKPRTLIAKDILNNIILNRSCMISAGNLAAGMDKARSLGVALPACGFTVDQLINFGIIKLKNK